MKKFISILFLLCSINAFAQTGKVGIGTTNPQAMLHVADSAVLFTGPISAPATTFHNPPASGPGTRMMWYPQKAAFRVGVVDNNDWNKDSIGRYSFATGGDAKAFGLGSFASGFYSNAHGDISTSMGLSTNAIGDYSTAMGAFNYARGITSTTMGSNTVARSNNSLVAGTFNDTTNTNTLFEIGNGTANNARSNALTVLTNGNMGIGTVTPTSKLDVNGQVTIDQKNFGGYGGLLIKGNTPGSNYPNIAFSTKNNAATPLDVIAATISGMIIGNIAGAESVDLSFATSTSGLAGLSERLVIKANGNVGIATTTPTEKLEVNGNIKAQSYKLATPKTSYYSVPPSAFQAMSSSDVISVGSFSVLFNGFPTPSGGIVAPVNLPQGATVTSFTLYFYDNAAGTDIKGELRMHNHGSNSGAIMASVSSAGVPLGANGVDNTVSNSIIDHQYFDYSIEVYSTVGAWPGSSLMLYSAVITYTVSEVN
jgi:hypothetical protein